MVSTAITIDPWNEPPADLWWPPGPAGELLRSRHSVVPVVGAGFSRGAGLPLGWELARWLTANHEPWGGGAFDPQHADNCVAVAGEIVGPLDRDQHERSLALREEVAAFYDLAVHDASPTIAAWALVRAPSRLIINLNYDLLLEQAAADQEIAVQSYTWQDLPYVNQLLASGGPSELAVVHVHGAADRASTIVLDAAGYAQIQNDRNVDDFWSSAARSKRMCFLGVTLDEPYVIDTLSRLQGGSQQHVMIADAATRQKFGVRMGLDVARHGINVVELPGHSMVDGFAWQLTSVARRAGAGGPVIAKDTAQLPHYIANTLVEPDPERSEEVSSLLAEWDFEGVRRWRSLFASPQESFDESDLAGIDRALIIGAPGSGKSELMRHTGRLVPDAYLPVFIRLSGIRPRSGNPAVALMRWAETGSGLVDDVNVGLDALANTSIHFFLDALDEVPVSQQAAVIAQIIDFASQFPQHRFTVSTRPIDGLDGFMNGRWTLLRITPTHRWQDAYLKACGLDWSRDIEPLLQGINDAREILRLPFFLSRVVDMRDKGQLAAQQDLWGLLQALVDDALGREEGMLDLLPEEAREWLRRVALAMLLAGRATLTQHEIEQIALPASVSANHTEVCNTLVLRLLLRPSDVAGEIGFTHRFFAAALAAEAVADLGPAPELLDAFVPSASELVSGVRRDALVPLTLLMERDAAWRHAVAQRDTVAAARTTPTSASHEEREAAARALWRRYVDWGVWMWDHDLPEIAEDARALGRLLAVGDLPELVDELKGAMRGSQLDALGNAIAVLSFAGLIEIEPDLRDILTDEDAPGVIRRQATLAAARLDLDDLLPLIVELAATTPDDMEAQDCSLAAMRMVGAEGVVEVASRLIHSRNNSARNIALSHARRMASPEQMVGLLVDTSAEDNLLRSRQADMLLDVLDNIEQATPDTVRRVAYLAAIWEVPADDVAEFLGQEREAAAIGLGDAMARGNLYAWEIMDLLGLFTLDEAVAAGWPEEFRAHARPDSAPEPDYVGSFEPAAAEPTESPPDTATDRSGVEEEPDAPEPESELGGLLKRPRDDEIDNTIAHNSQYLAPQATDLPAELKQDLAARLDSWWPDRPYAETITWNDREGGRSWSQENGPAAWVWYGPAIDKDLTPTQWAQIATSGVAAFNEQHDWLRRHCTDEAVAQIADLLTNDNAERWHQALQATPEQHELPTTLIETATSRIRTGDSYYVIAVAERLAAWAGETPARQLASSSDAFADALRPLLAHTGDHEAIDHLLDGLRNRLQAGEAVDGDTLYWLDGIGRDPSWLDQLFECLRLSFVRPTSGPRDTTGPLAAIIEHIAAEHPDDVLQRFDNLFHAEPECRWLRGRREGVVYGQLGALGLAAAPTASEFANVPYLPAET
jgi:hypothetical protein